MKTVVDHPVARLLQFLAKHVKAFLWGEQIVLFLGVIHDGNDHFIDEFKTPSYDVDMSIRRWVKRARVYGAAFHSDSSPSCW